jgi:hypothetical protein
VSNGTYSVHKYWHLRPFRMLRSGTGHIVVAAE